MLWQRRSQAGNVTRYLLFYRTDAGLICIRLKVMEDLKGLIIADLWIITNRCRQHFIMQRLILIYLSQSGIPLRVFDVLGCGGFLITNYQHEIAECFENGRELVIYEDIPDLIVKVNYYLTHENERLRIARNGYEKVKSEYTFEKRMKSILSDIL
jgi:spore maturation protein CgeB